MSQKCVAAFNRLAILLSVCACCAASQGQQARFPILRAHRSLNWPQTEVQAYSANKLPKQDIDLFLDNLGEGPLVGAATKVLEFRFVRLEPGLFGLAVVVPARRAPIEVVTPVGGNRFRFFPLEGLPNGGLLATSLVDMDGDGSQCLIVRSPVADRGASTDPIYWYRIYKWDRGVPQDVSVRFPEFYREFVLPQVDYPERLLTQLKARGAKDTKVPLAEIAYVRLKYERDFLGHGNAGLEQALAWAESKNSDLITMGIASLSEMRSQRAWAEIDKLRNSTNYVACMGAREAWFRSLGKPMTPNDECTRPSTPRK